MGLNCHPFWGLIISWYRYRLYMVSLHLLNIMEFSCVVPGSLLKSCFNSIEVRKSNNMSLWYVQLQIKSLLPAKFHGVRLSRSRGVMLTRCFHSIYFGEFLSLNSHNFWGSKFPGNMAYFLPTFTLNLSSIKQQISKI